MTVLILQTGEPLEIDEDNSRPMRAMNLSERLNKDNIKVEIVSSKFHHTKKIQRKIGPLVTTNSQKKTYLLRSPGYNKNIGIRRLIDHSIMALSLFLYLIRKKDKPDLVFIGFPPIETSLVMVIYCLLNKIPYVLDIKDLWPFIFTEHLPSNWKKILFYLIFPYIKMANFCTYNANVITGPSTGYLNSIKKLYTIGNKTKTYLFPLSSTYKKNIISKFDLEEITNFIKKKDAPIISFAGSLMKSAYEFETFKKALKNLEDDEIKYNFIIAGDGELKKELINLFSDLKNITFTGWLNQSKLEALYSITSLLIAPYKNNLNYKGHIPNKVYDAFRSNIPLITSLEGDAAELIKKYKIGYVYRSGDSTNLSSMLSKLILNKELVIKLRNNIKSNLNYILPEDEAYKRLVSLYYQSIKSNFYK